MDKEFAPYDLALQLKELGFNKKCLGFYYRKVLYTYDQIDYTAEGFINGGFEIQAPLWQQAFDFLLSSIADFYRVIQYSRGMYQLHKYVDEDESYNFIMSGSKLECLKKLIEIVKQNEK